MNERALRARFDADLARRANPERSRLFDRARLEQSISALVEYGKTPTFRLPGEAVQIVGSKGKGSTAFFLAELSARSQKANEWTVGLFTSPHLLDVSERIRINQKPADGVALWQAAEQVHDELKEAHEALSYFEFLTLVAIRVFINRGVDLAVFEAGLGGRFDATRMVPARTVLLTRIEREHTAILGESRRAILSEKLGILSDHARRLVVMPQHDEITRTLVESAAHAHNPGLSLHFQREAEAPGTDYLSENRRFAAFALRAMGSGSANEELIRDYRPPGRLEVRRSEKFVYVFDVAHSPDSVARSLRDMQRAPDRVVFACLKDRDPLALLAVPGMPPPRQIIGVEDEQFAPLPRPYVRYRPDRIAALLLETLPDGSWVAFLGTHRTYALFCALSDHGATAEA